MAKVDGLLLIATFHDLWSDAPGTRIPARDSGAAEPD
jgi:hypothetical protein